MKNKGLIILIISVVVVVAVSIMYVSNIKVLDYNLLNTKWFHYDYKTGYYEVFYLDENALMYYYPNSDNKTGEYSFCKKYKYNRINNTISFDCGKKIHIKEVNKNYLVIDLDSKELSFYKNIFSSINHEFNKYFNMNMNDYKKKNAQALEIIKINKDEIYTIIKDEDYSKIIFMGDKCDTISCILINDVIEKWISFSKNIYFVDSNSLDLDFLKNLNKNNNNFSLNIDDYNDNYPTIYVIGKNTIIDKYNIKCSGFNCSMYYNK